MEAPVELVFQENESFAFGTARHCAGCSRVLAEHEVDPDFELRNRTFDVSVTNDGAVIVTEAFVVACAGMPSVRFESLASEPDYAVMLVDREVRVDPFGCDIITGETCEYCHGPRYRIRRGPLHLRAGELVEPGFSSTDLTFGDTADFGLDQPVRLRPHILLDRATARVLKGAGLIGVHLIAQP